MEPALYFNYSARYPNNLESFSNSIGSTILNLKLTAVDVKNAGMITLSCAIATLLSRWLGLSQLIWVIVIVALLPFSKIGHTAKARHLSLILTGIASALGVAITIYLNSVAWVVITWLFVAAFVLYCLPRYIAGCAAPGLFILVFMVIAHSLPGNNLAAALQCIPAILLGTFIVVCMNGLFDQDKTALPLIPLDTSLYLIQRALRVAILLTVAFLICHFFQIQNASWVAFTVIVVDQNTLGASAKRACQRLLGTAAGVVAGILLAHFLFAPYPPARWAALLIVFLTFLFVRVNYTFTIFFATILLANIFYVLSGSTSIVTYMISRMIDILIGVAIGVIGQMLLFPRSLVLCLRQNYARFWSDAAALIAITDAENRAQDLTKLDQDLKKIEQDLKDFRYEPISFLFKRYHLSVLLIPLIRNFLIELKNMPTLPPRIVDFTSQMIQTILFYYKDPDLSSVTPLENALTELAKLEMDPSLDAKVKPFLINLQKMLEHFKLTDFNSALAFRIKIVRCA